MKAPSELEWHLITQHGIPTAELDRVWDIERLHGIFHPDWDERPNRHSDDGIANWDYQPR